MTEKNLPDAVSTAIYQMERQNYNADKAVGYAHPTDIDMAWKELLPYRSVGEPNIIHGVRVEEGPHMERGVFVLAHLEAMRYGSNAIQTVSFEEDE